MGGESLRIPRESIILFYNEYGQGQRERQIMSFVMHPSIWDNRPKMNEMNPVRPSYLICYTINS